jgi:hypothetical protein
MPEETRNSAPILLAGARVPSQRRVQRLARMAEHQGCNVAAGVHSQILTRQFHVPLEYRQRRSRTMAHRSRTRRFAPRRPWLL